MQKFTIRLILLFLLFSMGLYAQNTVIIPALKDNTLFEDVNGEISNGAGDYLFFGSTNQNELRRALLMFDVDSVLESGDSIINVSLKFEVSKLPSGGGNGNSTIHTVSQNWGESTSDASGEEGSGAQAENGDATWTVTCYNCLVTGPWGNQGGDFNSVASDSFQVSSLGVMTVSGPGLSSDVQSWIDNPGSNFGWILVGDENTTKSARRINSRENSSNPPSLEITYIRDVSTSIEKSLSDRIKISPNPAQDQFKISGLDETDIVQAFNISGNEVAIKNLENGFFDISELQSGVYYLKMTIGDSVISKKIIKN